MEVGSRLPYAGIHQWGGESSQPITDAAKKKIGSYIGEEKRDGKWVRKKRMGSRQEAQREKYWYKLFPLLSMEELSTSVNQRPFLGITEENENEMAELIELFVATGKK